MLMYGVHHFTLQDDGTPDPKFPTRYGGGVLAFINQGTLRSASEIDTPLTEYADMKEERCRRRKQDTPTDWKFTVNDLWTLGKKFGLAGPPSPEEVRAEQERRYAEEQKKRERDAILEKEFTEKYEAAQKAITDSPEGQRLTRVGEIVENIVGLEEFKFHPRLVGLGISKEAQEQTNRWLRTQEIKTLRPIIDDITKRTTYAPETLIRRWKQAEQDYKELIDNLPEETIMKLSPVEEFAYKETLSEYSDKGTWEPWSLYGEPRRELESGETRLTFKTHAGLVAHMRAHPEHWWDAEKATVWMDDDRSFVMDYVPEAEQA
jgi:hypothetical protein